ncbi:hypothetical protein GQ457_10G013900 [Hibiscus cannabinus]
MGFTISKTGFEFDYESWYPLNRIVGGTLYPGLMVTVALIYRILHFGIYISEFCILTVLFFASNTTLVAYFFGKEIWNTGSDLSLQFYSPFVLGTYQVCCLFL